MSTLILTRGVPASGKSTWAKAWVAQEPTERVRVNRDDLRAMQGFSGRGTHEQEERVTDWQRQIVTGAFQRGQSVVVDDTNLRAKYAKEWLMLARAYGVPVEFQDFPISQSEAIERDRLRGQAGGMSVGRDVIADFYGRYCSKAGDLPPIPVLPENEEPKFKFPPVSFVLGAPFAILVDIDGTLAHMEGRSPYDPTLYHTDSFDYTVGEIASSYALSMGCRIIVMSGRDEQYRSETEKWLRDYNFEYHHLYMRPQGDTRNDAIVKNELYEKYIAGKYNVNFVLDDRDRVVAMWRAKGLKVLQVAEGNF